MIRLIDTHAHLYSRKFDHDREAMIERAVGQGVASFYLPNIDRTSIEPMLALAKAYPERCFPMMGLHPCSVKDNYREELAAMEDWLGRRSFCAVGEIGIDLYWDKTHVAEQQEAFRTQVSWARDLGLPVVIHSRESTDMILELLQPLQDGRVYGVFHCFTGDEEQAAAAIDLGFVLGIGGVLTFKNAGLDRTVANIDLKHLVLETDAPYLAPVPYRGKRNESSYVRLVAEKLAAIKDTSLEEVAAVTTANAEALFSAWRKETAGKT